MEKNKSIFIIICVVAFLVVVIGVVLIATLNTKEVKNEDTKITLEKTGNIIIENIDENKKNIKDPENLTNDILKKLEEEQKSSKPEMDTQIAKSEKEESEKKYDIVTIVNNAKESEKENKKEIIIPKKPQKNITKKETKKPTKKITPKKNRNYVQRYFIQVGSFSVMSSAEAAKKNLKESGITSNIQTTTIKNKVWYQVVIGAFKTKSEADNFLPTVKKLPNFKSAYVKSRRVLE